MYELYCKFRDKKGYKDSDVSKMTGIPASTFSDWKSGRSKPNTEKLSKMADVLDTMVEYFDSPKGILITCPDCGLTYVSTEKNDIKEHEKFHSAWQDAEKKFGTIYGNYPICEKIKARNRNIRDNKKNTLEERYAAELEVLRCLFSRSVEATGYDLRHVTYEEYVAMMMYGQKYRQHLGDELYKKIVDNFGTMPGIVDGESYYHVPEQPETIAAHKDENVFTPEELQKIEEYKRLLLAARPKE